VLASCLRLLMESMREDDLALKAATMEQIQPGWAWTEVPAVVRDDMSRYSAEIGKLAAQECVRVKEVRGTRARISEPLAGWVSTVSRDGVQVLTGSINDQELIGRRDTLLKLQKTQRKLHRAIDEVAEKHAQSPMVQQVMDAAGRGSEKLQEARQRFEAATADFRSDEPDADL